MSDFVDRDDAGRCPNEGRPSERCPYERCTYEDMAIAASLDGDGGADAGFDLALHLDGCERCREVIEQTRELDAMIASATSTDVDDATADRMLAFLADVQQPVATRSRSLPLWFVVGGAAAALVVGTLLLTKKDPPPVDRVAVESPRAVVVPAPPVTPPERPVDTVSTPAPRAMASTGHARASDLVRSPGLTLSIVWEPPKPEAEPVADRPLVTVLDDEAAPEAVDETLARVRTLFAERGDVATEVAAVRWLTRRIDDGRLSPRDARIPLDALFASRGETRRALADVFRSARLDRMILGRARVPRTRRRVDAHEMRRVALVGALGLVRYTRQLAGAPREALERCVAEALATGDAESVAFALELFIDVSLRHGRAFERAERWFGAVASGREALLERAITRRLEAGCSITFRELYAAILEVFDRPRDSELAALPKPPHSPLCE